MCDSCEEKDERIRQLEAELYGKHWDPPHEFSLTPSQAAILCTLVAHDRVISKGLLVDATRSVPNAWASDISSNVIDTQMCRLRAIFRRYGLEIETHKGRGYKLTPSARMALLNWPGGKQEAA